MRNVTRICVALALGMGLALAATPAAAETYTVTLVNGKTIESRYQPQEASWNPDMVLIMTDQGNQIALPRAEITNVVSETEARGFGKRIDTMTVDLGFAPNVAPEPEEEDQFTRQLNQLQQVLQSNQQQQNYDIQQFLSPSEINRRGSGGLPVGYGAGIGSGGSGIGPVAFPVTGGGGS